MKTNRNPNKKLVLLILFTIVAVPFSVANAWVIGPNHEMVVGWEDPNEVDTVSGTLYSYGDLYIMKNATLNIVDANFNIGGDVYVIGNGTLNITNSEFNILNATDFQYGAIIVDDAQLNFENSVLSTNGHSSHMYVANDANVSVHNSNLSTDKYAWLIAYFVDNASLDVIDSEFPKEVIPEDNARVYVNNSNVLASAIAVWLNFHYNVQADLHELKGPFERSNVSIDPCDPNISGINYSIVVEDAYIYWLVNTGYFCDITIRDSSVSMVLFLYGYNGKTLENLAPTYFSDYQLPLYDFERVIILKNTSVVYWQMYLSGFGNEWAETYKIFDSEINELIIFDETYVRMTNSIIGPAALGTLFTAQLSITDSILRPIRVAAFDDSKITLEGCRLEGPPVIAQNRASIYLKNVELAENTDNPHLPAGNPTSLNAFGSGRIYLANIDPNSGTFPIGETIPITGSATIKADPESAIQFKNYQFEYSLRGSDIWEPMSDIHTEPVMDGELETWDTTGITEAGKYLLKLVITDTNDSTFHSFGQVDLVNP